MVKDRKKYRILQILLRVFLIFIALFWVFVFALTIPSVQTFIAQKFVSSIRAKTGAQFTVKSVKIIFPKNIILSDIYIGDKQSDTLLYVQSLKINIDIFKLLSNKVYAEDVSLENMVGRIYRNNSDGKFNFQFFLDAFLPLAPDTIAEPSVPWLFQMNKISLKNIHLAFIDKHTDTDVKINLGDFEGLVKVFDLDKKHIELDKFSLKNSSVQLISTQAGTLEKNLSEKSITTEKKKVPGLVPGWHISTNHLVIENSDFKSDNTAVTKLPEGFDSQHVFVSNINTQIHNINISDDGFKGEINALSFNEGCGFDLKKLSANANLTERVAELKNLQFESSRSKISADAQLSFSSFDDLLSNTGNTETKMDLKYADINSEEVFLVAYALTENKYISKFRNSNVLISTKATGKINDLNFEHLEISGLQKTTLKSHGRLTGLPDVARLRFNAGIDFFSIVLPDVYQFIDSKSLANLNLPHSIALKGNGIGKADSLLANVQLTTEYGTVDATTFYQTRKNGRDTFNLIFSGKNILANRILGDTLFGKVSISGKAGIARTSDSLLYGLAEVVIAEAQYNSYNYRNIKIDGRMDGKFYSSTVSCADTNITFELHADADRSEVKKKYSTALNLSRLNFEALHFTQKKLTMSTNLTAQLNYGGLNNSDATLNMANTILTNDGKNIPVDTFVKISRINAPCSAIKN